MEVKIKMCEETEPSYLQQLNQGYAESAYHALPFALCILDKDLKILWSNSNFNKLLPTGDISQFSEILRTFSFKNLTKLRKLLSGGSDNEVISIQYCGQDPTYLNFKIIHRVYDQYISLLVSENETLSSCLERQLGSLREKYCLSETEALIAKLIAEGNSIRKITNIRHVSVATVRSQLRQLREKMGVSSSLEIASKIFSDCLSATGQYNPTGPKDKGE